MQQTNQNSETKSHVADAIGFSFTLLLSQSRD